MKICIARVDRIGDLVLTLPCEKLWKANRPQDTVDWLVPSNLAFLMDQASPKPHALFVGSPQGLAQKWKEMLRLRRALKENQYDHFVAVHVPWWVAAAAWSAGIKKITGVASQWFSWLFFNRRLRQKRSESTQHEAQYNFDLIRFALDSESFLSLEEDSAFATLNSSQILNQKWSQIISEKKLNSTRVVVIHPGMGGSARNWPPQQYRTLALKLLEEGVSVVVTGGDVDRDFIEATGLLQVSGVTSFVGQTQGSDLLSLLHLAKVVVAPSTGVAHLAASLGKAVAGLYSPVRVQAPIRWRPRGNKVKVFVPSVSCPGIHSCLGSACSQFDCMGQIPVESVLAYVMSNL